MINNANHEFREELCLRVGIRSVHARIKSERSNFHQILVSVSKPFENSPLSNLQNSHSRSPGNVPEQQQPPGSDQQMSGRLPGV